MFPIAVSISYNAYYEIMGLLLHYHCEIIVLKFVKWPIHANFITYFEGY